MKNNKSEGNDEFPKEFHENFRAKVAKPFLNFIETAKLKTELSSSQRQVG